jgi:cell division protein FtsN
VERKTEVEQKVEATVKTIRTNSRNPRVMLRVAAIILPLIALSYLSISQQERINNIYTQMASLNPFETTATVEIVSEVIPVVKIEVVATPIVEVIEEEIVPVIIPEKTYYIIAGAFAEQKNADKMLAKLENWSYNTEIVPGGNLLRVSYDSFTNKADALVALHQIKQENSAAWLLSL